MSNSPVFFLLIFILKINALQAQWQEFPTPVGGTALSLAEQNGVFFAGSYNHAFRSYDGELWSRLEALPPFGNATYELQTEGDRVYAHLYEGFGAPVHSQAVYYSTDQGDHWTSIPIGNDSKRIFFSGQRVFRLNNSNVLYKSDDDGAFWQQVWSAPPDNAILDLEAWNGELRLYTVYNMLGSTDNGSNWTVVTNGILAMTGPDAVPESQMFAAGPNIILNSGVIKIISSDGGVNAIPIQPEMIDGRFYDIVEFQGVLYAAHGANYYVSFDGGFNWEARDGLPVITFLTDGATLWAGGYSGIFRSTDGENWTFSGKNILELYSGYIGEVLPFEGGMAVKSWDGTLYVSTDDAQSFDFVTFNTSGRMIATDNGNIIALPYRYNIAGGTLDTIIIPGISDVTYCNFSYGDGQLLASRDFQSVFWRSLDDGITWDSIPMGTSEISYTPGLIDGRLFLTFQSTEEVRVTEDLGATWTNFTLGMSFNDANAWYKQLHRIGDILLLEGVDSTYRYTPAGWQRWSKSDVKWTGGDGHYFGWSVAQERQLLVFNEDASIATRLDSSNFLLDLSLPMSYGNHALYGIGQSAISALRYPVIYKLDVSGFENGLVSGQVFLDTNSNDTLDPQEAPQVGNIVSSKPLSAVTTTNSYGDYTFLFWQQNDTIRPQLPSPHYRAHPPYYLVNQAATGLDFAIQPQPDALDYEIHATAHNVFRPGFNTNITLTCSNPGTVDQGFTVTAILPDFMHLDVASPTPDAVVNDTITWNLPGLQSLSSTDIVLTVQTEIFPALGTVFDIHTEIGPLASDLNISNNVSIIHDTLVGSYDPNDKAVFPETLTPEQLTSGEALTYRVRFQNTGNYPASIVRVLDTLSNNLDVSTLRILSSSHLMTWHLTSGKILEFVFQNINLPDSSSNEPGSHGFVLFSIKPKPNLPIGTAIPNQAAIYFDFNLPVFTNISQMLVKQTVAVHPEFALEGNLHLFPNPASGKITVTWTDKTQPDNRRISINDLSGRTVFDLAIATGLQQQTLDIRHLPQGLYFLQMTSGSKVLAVEKFVKQ